MDVQSFPSFAAASNLMNPEPFYFIQIYTDVEEENYIIGTLESLKGVSQALLENCSHPVRFNLWSTSQVAKTLMSPPTFSSFPPLETSCDSVARVPKVLFGGGGGPVDGQDKVQVATSQNELAVFISYNASRVYQFQ